jgi:hypothetical protein
LLCCKVLFRNLRCRGANNTLHEFVEVIDGFKFLSIEKAM